MEVETIGSELSQIVRTAFEDACKCFTDRIRPFGFVRGKTRFWTRPHTLTADFIHFHRSGSSYGAPHSAEVNIVVYLGIRILNNAKDSLILNGPQSSPDRVRAGRYHLRFNAKSRHMFDRCMDDLIRFITVDGEQWFASFADPQRILTTSDLTFTPEDKIAIADALVSGSNRDRLSLSCKLLGIKPQIISQTPPPNTTS